MPKEFIVAIELGSSKMTGIAGQKNLDGSITVLAVVQENSSSCIRKGVIYNIDKTGQCLISIIKKLKNILQQDITQVYVLLDDADEALPRLVDVIDNTLSDARR